MTWSECKALILADLYRYEARSDVPYLIRSVWGMPGFRYMFLFRLCGFLKSNALLKFSIYPLFRFGLVRTGTRYGIRIPLSCKVGAGLSLDHWGGIWVNPAVQIGCNCSLGHEVTLGHVSRGPTRGEPVIGDCVYLGPGAKILGKITVGDHALVSANSLVIQDVPENGVVIGVPARLFSRAGSGDYVVNTVGVNAEPVSESKPEGETG